MKPDTNGHPGRRSRRVATGLASPRVQRTLVFFAGLALTVHESFRNGAERPSLYVLYAGMMGFPLVDIYARRRDEADDE